MDTQRKARGGPREHRRSNSGMYKVCPFVVFLFYSTNKNLTTLTIPQVPEHNKHEKHTQMGASMGIQGTSAIFYFLFKF